MQPSGILSVRNVIEAVMSDQPRTKAFIGATKDRIRNFNGDPRIVYEIGCGPFPIPAIVAALETPNAIVRCIEINPLSAKIADLVIKKLRLEDRITIQFGNALDPAMLPKAGETIDVLFSETAGVGLMDEQLTKILPRYARYLTPDKGVAIPQDVRLSAALVPNNKGITQSPRENKYPLILDTRGEYMPRIPASEWKTIMEADLTEVIAKVIGTIEIPDDVTPQKLDEEYMVGVAAEFFLAPQKKRILERYRTVPTSPALLTIHVPEELKEEDPRKLEIRIEYAPGSRSDDMTPKATVMRKN